MSALAEKRFPEEQIAALKKFANTVWGNAQAVIRRSDDIEFIDLAEYFDAFSTLFSGPLKHDKVLVRDEYRIAHLELETNRHHYGAYVTGHPGIGKTLFLLYLIVALLGQKSAVALQDPGGKSFYVLFNNGTVSFHSLDNRVQLLKCGFVWGLSDSNKYVECPDSVFVGDPDRTRVVQTTPPTAAHWKEWSKQTGAQCYVMDIWHEKELANLAILLGLDVKRMITLAKKWGGAPQNLLRWFHEDDAKIMDDIRSHAGTAVERCGSLISEVINDDITDKVMSVFYFSRPWRNGKDIDRTQTSATVQTRALSHILGRQLQEYNDERKLEFFNALSQNRGTCAAAGVVFKSWFHSFLAAGNTIQYQWVQGIGAPSLRGPLHAVPSTQDAPETGKPPFLWVAPHGFPGIDSALVFEDAVYAIQVTIGSEHKQLVNGLEILREHLPARLGDVSWKVVFVRQAESTTKGVARSWAGELSFPTGATPLSIGWSAVNPFVEKVTYPDYSNEPDEMIMDVEQGV